MENIFSINNSLFDILKEIDGNYFSALFGEDLGEGAYKHFNVKYVDKIEEIINKNKGNKILIIYDSNQKYELVKRLEKNPNVNIVRITKERKTKN